MKPDEARLEALAQRIATESDMLAYPSRSWVNQLTDAAGRPVLDVLIVGAGQCGLAVGQGLIRDGITNILLIDRNPEGYEGPWLTYARMNTLRTPKSQVGMDHGLPSLTTRAWYEAKYGPGSWDAVERVSREDWMGYLRWYRKVLNLPVRNNLELVEVAEEQNWFRVTLKTPKGAEVVRARRIIMATGFEGNGEWRVPDEIAAALPPERRVHSNTVIDFARYRCKRVGILGHGASAFDAAITAIQHGAQSADICFRREMIPTINPYRGVEYVGFLKDFSEMKDSIRWSLNYFFDVHDQPPAKGSFELAQTFSNFAMHNGSPWLEVGMAGGDIRIRTPHRTFLFDEVICATGSVPDLGSRIELHSFSDDIALWRDRYTPPAHEAREILGFYPYLGSHYELQEKVPGSAPFLNRIYAFNFSAILSMGPHSTSISGHKYSVPRIIRGVTRSLFLEQQDGVMDGIKSFREPEIVWPSASQHSECATGT
jgi:cation diffusion facilitator CzcD-associated flavoprotein CzcO